MTTIKVTREYPIYVSDYVTLPEGRTWADIEGWYVRYDTFFYRFKGEQEWREEMFVFDYEGVDTKTAKSIEIEEALEDEDGDYYEGESLDSVTNY